MSEQSKVVNSEVALAEMHRELDRLFEKHKYVEVQWTIGSQRTLTQNRALHMWFQWLAETLNDAGLDMRTVIKPEVEIPWSGASVKEYLWRPVQEALIQKHSTTEANRVEYTEVYDVLCRHLGDKFGVQCPPWPKRKDAE